MTTRRRGTKAGEELPKWFKQERSDVERERELYQREMTMQGNAGPNLTEEDVAKKEAALERQIGEHTRLLLQLKTKRSQWSRPSGEPEPSSSTNSRQVASSLRSRQAVRPASSGQAVGIPDNTDAALAPGKSSSSSGVPSASDSFGADARNVSENASREQKTAVNGTVATENEKIGQSNLVSAV